MSQSDYIKDIARFGLENDREKLLASLNELIKHSKNTKKINFALQLQSILKESLRRQETAGGQLAPQYPLISSAVFSECLDKLIDQI